MSIDVLYQSVVNSGTEHTSVDLGMVMVKQRRDMAITTQNRYCIPVDNSMPQH